MIEDIITGLVIILIVSIYPGIKFHCESLETKKKRGKKMKKENDKKEVEKKEAEKILIDDFEGEGGSVEISLEAIKKGGIILIAKPKK